MYMLLAAVGNSQMWEIHLLLNCILCIQSCQATAINSAILDIGSVDHLTFSRLDRLGRIFSRVIDVLDITVGKQCTFQRQYVYVLPFIALCFLFYFLRCIVCQIQICPL